MSMRITNSMMSAGMLSDINTNLNRMDKMQRQMTSEKRITRISDDPVGVISIMQSRARMRRMEQYQTSVDTAQSWLRQGEEALQDINQVLVDAYEQAVYAATDGKTGADKKAISEYIGQLMEHLVQTGNAALGEQYVFAGYNTTKTPFSADPATGVMYYNGIPLDGSDPAALAAVADNRIEFEVGFGLTSEVSFNGIDVMGTGDQNLYKVLYDLKTALDNDAPAGDINKLIGPLQDAQNIMLGRLAEYGGKVNRLDMISDRYAADILNYTERISLIEDIDLTEVLVSYKTAASVYSAALQASASIQQLSLMNYLR